MDKTPGLLLIVPLCIIWVIVFHEADSEAQCATPSPCTGEADCTSVNGVDTCSCRAGYEFAANSTTNCVGFHLTYGTNVGDASMPQADDSCLGELDAPYGVPFRGNVYSKIHVCPNGIMCFDRSYQGYTIPHNKQYNADLQGLFCLAPYFSDLTVAAPGGLFYQAYDHTTDRSAAAVEVYNIVKALVENTYDIEFNPSYVVKVTWSHLPPFAGGSGEEVSVQLIYVTNGKIAIAYYNYENMTLMTNNQFIGVIVDGYTDGLDDSADGWFLRRPDFNLIGLDGSRGSVSFQVEDGTEDGTAETYGIICRSWHTDELPKKDSYIASLWQMPTCPCSSFFITRSFDRSFSQDWGTFDYATGVWSYPAWPGRTYPQSKTCNYFRGAYIGSGSQAGAFQTYSELWFPREHENNDRYYKEVCCERSNFCDLYHDVRPTLNVCYTVFQWILAFLFGDPHITTLDGRQYTFNGHGEYILMKLQDLEIQCRTEKAITASGEQSQATIFSGFAVQGDGVWLQVELSTEKNGVFIFAGNNNTAFSDYTSDYNTTANYSLTEVRGMTLDRVGNTTVTLFTGTGIMFNVTVGNGLLTMSLGVGVQYKSQTIGLLGNFNGDKTDDLIPRSSSTPLPDTSSEREIFANFGQTWMTTASESLFQYTEGYSIIDFNFPNFTPIFIDEADPNVLQQANVICNNNTQCVFDYVATGDAALARSTEASEEEAELLEVETSNEAPSLTVVSGTTTINEQTYLYVEQGTPTTFTVNASDDGTVTLEKEGTPLATVGTAAADGTYDVSLTLSDASPVNLSLIAVDDKGLQSQELDVIIVQCSNCNGHGTCNYTATITTSSETFKYATCVCTPYWEGADCETDKDGCADGPCSTLRTCTDTIAANHEANPNLPPFVCGPCPSGYVEDGDKCNDINECTSVNNPHNCDATATCVNTEGAFTCQCNDGYRSSDTGCTDINECDESLSNCAQVCTNEAGSFTCSCYTGYTYDAGANTCTQATEPTGCNALDCSQASGCTLNDANDTVCFCNAGYQLQQDNTCSDIIECDTGACPQDCTNSVGSFTCSCYIGYTLASDRTTCNLCAFPSYGVNCASTCQCGTGAERCDPVSGCICKAGWTGTRCETDINECLVNNVCGDVNKVCTNNAGSYTCTCRAGYTLDTDQTCKDVDECSSVSLNLCAQECSNTVGGFTCSCRTGYNVDPNNDILCVDYDECDAGVADCEQVCRNGDGRYSCECYFGFLLNDDRTTCTRVSDPCTLFPDTTCAHICRVVNQQPICLCNAGFFLASDGESCSDINECNDANLNQCSKHDSCVNSAGGYACSCDVGSKLGNDQRTCQVCDEFHYGENCANECNCGVGATNCDSVSGCVCASGWSGVTCNSDEDECSVANNCTGNNELCVNIPGSYECACATGYQRDSQNACVDIDECASASLSGCSLQCDNTEGSFSCSCNDGFTQNQMQCNDIDECAGQHDCSQTCSNTVGGYRCSCSDGFTLDLTDRKTCTVSEVCTVKTCTNADCAVISTVETCVCLAGFRFATNSDSDCEDIKECDRSPSPCTQQCVEQDGGYECACNQDGFKLDTDLITCIPCTEWTYGDNCTETCTCNETNTELCNAANGECTCNQFWTCTTCDTDINECNNAAVHRCTGNSTCQNFDGGFNCQCDIGFFKQGDGTCKVCDNNKYGLNCAETCPCDAANSQSCDREDGTCTCKIRWTGSDCTTDLNECNINNICGGDPLKECVNSPGSHACNCIDGYTINTDNACIDNDECALDTDNTCDYVCTNVPGSFECSCGAGYTGTENACTECTAGKWGVQCANTCNCNSTNIVECNPATGCTCKTGWTGTTCDQDVDKCTNGTHTCPADSTCTNNDGAYTCPCNIGFSASNNLCAACTEGTYGDNCTETCMCNETNTELCNAANGECTCNQFWNGTTCDTDINECNNAAVHQCTGNSTCQNFDGGFNCQCNIGFFKQGDDTCKDEETSRNNKGGYAWEDDESPTRNIIIAGSIAAATLLAAVVAVYMLWKREIGPFPRRETQTGENQGPASHTYQNCSNINRDQLHITNVSDVPDNFGHAIQDNTETSFTQRYPSTRTPPLYPNTNIEADHIVGASHYDELVHDNQTDPVYTEIN